MKIKGLKRVQSNKLIANYVVDWWNDDLASSKRGLFNVETITGDQIFFLIYVFWEKNHHLIKDEYNKNSEIWKN